MPESAFVRHVARVAPIPLLGGWPDLLAPSRKTRQGIGDPGRERADFVLGERDGTSCGHEFRAFAAKTLRGYGYSAAIDDALRSLVAEELERMA